MKVSTLILGVSTLGLATLVLFGCAGARTTRIESSVESVKGRVTVIENTTGIIDSLFRYTIDEIKQIRAEMEVLRKQIPARPEKGVKRK